MAVGGFCAFRIEIIGVIRSDLKVLLYHIIIVGFMLLRSASVTSRLEFSSLTLGFSKFSTNLSRFFSTLHHQHLKRLLVDVPLSR